MMTMLMTPNHDSLSPVAGWLSKMTHLPFGRSRWNSRFFVLLDSELRFYKDEVHIYLRCNINIELTCYVLYLTAL